MIDEGERLYLIMQEELGDDTSDEAVQRQGRNLFNALDQRTELSIRPRVTEPYVQRGSYHILSNSLKVGWHTNFLARLSHLLANTQGGAA